MSTGDTYNNGIYYTGNSSHSTATNSQYTTVSTGTMSTSQTIYFDGTTTMSTHHAQVMTKLSNMISEKYNLDADGTAEWIFDKLDTIHQMQEGAVSVIDKISHK